MSLSELKDWHRLVTQHEQASCSKYVDLAPNDNAEEAKNYFDALRYATNNPKVSNIALTGPYGSGKSSIIKTFLKRYKGRPFLISLAAFLPEADESVNAQKAKDETATEDGVTRQEIERSILQQMLYGPAANSLPLSRFKRIQSPKWWSWAISGGTILGLAACWHLFQNRLEIENGTFFSPLDFTNWFNLTCFLIGLLFLWLLLQRLYIKSFGLSIKSISLKDLQITPEAAQEESILNRHLDEIIYFFQSTKYDLVIIEDLDRFNNPEIFVTLREINSLINANSGVKQRVRFLYALRDNMFVNTDRTKFFEFVIPVIPIINSSNSIDKVLEQGKRLSLESRLDSRFLLDVSRYLNDMRLIQNIFNEYAVYDEGLAAEGEDNLDPNKLLAILIYKNVIPDDFEDLHREKGNFAEILKQRDAFVSKAETNAKNQVSVLEQQINDAEKHVASDVRELRMIYATQLIAKMPAGYTLIEINGNQRTPVQSISSHENFEQLIERQQIVFVTPQGHRQGVDISDLQQKVNVSKTYQERKAEIEGRTKAFKDSANKKIRDLRTKVSTLRTRKFNEIIRTNAQAADQLFDAFGENRELVKFLVFEGFLDDTYYIYTSLFHEGRLSPRDNRYIRCIRGFNNPAPDFQIDNPKAVIDAMREDDFRQNYILNKILVDYLLSDQNLYCSQVAKMIEFISSNFDACEDFFATYYANGRCITELLSILIEKWPKFVATLLAAPNSEDHVAQMIAYLPKSNLEALVQDSPEVSRFISENLSDILAVGVDFEPGRLALLEFETKDLKSIEPYPAIAQVLSDEGLYKISIENLEFIFRAVLLSPAVDDLRIKHYTTVLKSGDDAVINKVEADFEVYLQSVLLELDDNAEEDISTIIKVVSHDEIELQHLQHFLEKQSAKLPELNQIPTRLHSLVFQLRKIEATWDNCSEYLESDDFDPTILTAFLEQGDARNILSTITVNDQEIAAKLREFLISNNSFEVDAYRDYIRTLPKRFKQFPEDIDPEKWLILIEEEKVSFSKKSFSFLEGHKDLQVLFVAKNIEAYIKTSDEYELDEDFHEKLLSTEISDEQKLRIIGEMDLSSLPSLPARASVIGRILHRTGGDVSNLTAEVAQAIVNNAKPLPTRMSLFNKYKERLDDEQLRSTIAQLPPPYSEIKRGGGRPLIPNTPENLEFVRYLEARSFISSSTLNTMKDKIRINNFRK